MQETVTVEEYTAQPERCLILCATQFVARPAQETWTVEAPEATTTSTNSGLTIAQ